MSLNATSFYLPKQTISVISTEDIPLRLNLQANKLLIFAATHNSSVLAISLFVCGGYLLTHSTVQSPSWAADRFAASQEIPPHFTDPEGSLPHSQASATCLCPGLAQSSPYTHIPPLEDPF